jgi:hypothetical protein
MPQPSQKQSLSPKFLTPTRLLLVVLLLFISAIAIYGASITLLHTNNQPSHQDKLQTTLTKGSSDQSLTTFSSATSSRGQRKDSSISLGIAKSVGKDVISSNMGGDGDGDDPS